MKRRNREINVFNMSMLDLISGALGAVILLMLITLPYYKKEARDFQSTISQIRQELEAERSALAETQQENSALQEQIEQRQQQIQQQQEQIQAQASQNKEQAKRMAAKFLIAGISWDVFDDIDLHVRSPADPSFVYNYKKRVNNARPSAGRFVADSLRGGNEVWAVHQAVPGRYVIAAHVYKKISSEPVRVKFWYLSGDSYQEFGAVIFSRTNEERTLSLLVDAEGSVRVE